ncbi:WG repeat-containing protein [Runella sp.]|uniref:WG repeat-containing protein n=1 Tax=Runella sp. TaxID=1960881 RepID=UPI00301A21ED
MFSVITTQEGFSSDDEVLHFYNRELNCPCIVIYGEFTGASFVVNALYAGMEQNQIKFEGNKPKNLGAKVLRVWEVSYKTIETLKQTYSQKGDKYGWLEALETYTETHVGLFIQLMLDNLFSYSPRHVYEIKAPLFLQEKEEELTRLGIWEALKKTLLERYEVLKGRQKVHVKPIANSFDTLPDVLEKNKNSDNNHFKGDSREEKFVEFEGNSLHRFQIHGDTSWFLGYRRMVFHFSPYYSDEEGPDVLLERKPNFSNQLLRVISTEDGNYIWNKEVGLIDHNGDIVLPFEYSNADRVSEGYIALEKGKKWGLMDCKGRVKVPFEYDGLTSPKNGIVLFNIETPEQRGGIMDVEGNILLEGSLKKGTFTFSESQPVVDDLIVVGGREVINIEGRSVLDFSTRRVKYIGDKIFFTEKWEGGYVLYNYRAGKQIEIEVDQMLAQIGIPKSAISQDYGCWIDFSMIGSFQEGYSIICLITSVLPKNSNSWFDSRILRKRIEIAPTISMAAEGINTYKYWFAMSPTGKMTYIPEMEKDLGEDVPCFSNGKMAINTSRGWCYIDKKKLESGIKNYCSNIYDKALPYSNGLAAVKKGDFWGFMDLEENIVIPYEYTEVEPFSEGLAAVKKNEEFGVIDTQGQTIVPFVFESISKFCNGYACACLRRGHYGILAEWAIINKEGKILVM